MPATLDHPLTVIPEGVEPDRLSPSSMTIGWVDSEDGWPIVGLSYRTDYDGSEEWGIRKLRERITGKESRNFQMVEGSREHFALCSDQNAFAVSVSPFTETTFEWGDKIGGPFVSSDAYASRWSDMLGYVQGHDDAGYVRFQATMTELRAMAKALGVSPLPRSKDGLRDAIASHPDRAAQASRPNLWPVWFARGEVLVVRADTGPVADVVAGLRDAIRNGTFAIGDGSGPFCSGLFFHDAATIGPDMRSAIVERHEWHDARMAEAEPVLAELREEGFDVHFFGIPRPGGHTTKYGKEDDAVRYWLNGRTVRLPSGRRGQPFGWFSLDEMRDRVFLDRAEAYQDEVEARAARKA